MEIAMDVPLDSEGFVRRACPTCERELKWRSEEGGGSEPAEPLGGRYCPYCGVQAPPDAWWTEAQLAHAEYLALTQVAQPELRKLRRSGLEIKLNRIVSPEPLVEPDDMRAVVPTCHPQLPVKVEEAWTEPVCCSACGARA